MRNLGAKSTAMLEKAGIIGSAALASLGAAEAYVRVKRSGSDPSLNLLWALEGAIRDVPWQDVARNYRLELLLQVEDIESGSCPAGDPLDGVGEDIAALWNELGVDPRVVRDRKLPTYTEPTELVRVEVHRSGREIMLTGEAADAWKELASSAKSDGAQMYLISGFRSIQRQAELVQAKLDTGISISAVLEVLAPPGCSEHHSGCAVDIGAPGYAGLEEAFEESEAFRWLEANASKFGFSLSFARNNVWGYMYEPWHWCHCSADG